MTHASRILMGIGWLVLCTACVQNQDVLNMNDQFISLNKRVTGLEQSQGAMEGKLGSDLEARLKAIYTTQAELRLEIDRLKGELSKLTNRVEDNDNLIKRTLEKDLGNQDNMKAEIAGLSNRIKELDKAIKHVEENLLSGLDAAAKAQPQPVQPAQPAPSAGAAAQTPGAGSPTPESLKDESIYNVAFNAFKEGKLEEAIKGFKNLLEKFPKSDFADNAQFWIGESYMSMKQYDLAILAYQDVIKNYPTGNKVPNAMLRQGVAAELYGDKKLARALFKKVIEKFPNSNEAKVAKERLAKLG